jgi:8-oxo-dGTP pyrophosphatase MutT (NUDIX family)
MDEKDDNYKSFPLKKRKKKLYCSNCGKYGHFYKRCHEPITSLGVILFQINFKDIKKETEFKNINEELLTRSLENMESKRYINILHNNNKSYNSLKYIKYFKKYIKFLMVRRKNTLGYLEFIRGRYVIEDLEHIMTLFEQMTLLEIDNIKKGKFKDLWKSLWNNEDTNKVYELEYQQSYEKFMELKNNEQLNYLINNAIPKFNIPEWGFPKGRRNSHEKNKECSKRELEEETGLKEEDYILYNNINPLNETFKGTNGILYKHTYYLGLSKNNKEIKLDLNNKIQIEEIGDIGWFNYNEAIRIIRPYQLERKRILNELYIFIIDRLVKLNNKEYEVYFNKDLKIDKNQKIKNNYTII